MKNKPIAVLGSVEQYEKRMKPPTDQPISSPSAQAPQKQLETPVPTITKTVETNVPAYQEQHIAPPTVQSPETTLLPEEQQVSGNPIPDHAGGLTTSPEEQTPKAPESYPQEPEKVQWI